MWAVQAKVSDVTHTSILEQEAAVFTGNVQVAVKGKWLLIITVCLGYFWLCSGILGELNNRVFYFTTHSLSKNTGHF